MVKSSEILWAIEPHTEIKHKILESYLKAWFPILKKYNPRVVYLDGFSGPGRYSGGEPGSPVIALNVAKSFSTNLTGEIVFLFVEREQERIDNLNKEIEQLGLPGNFKVVAVCGEFQDVCEALLANIEARNQNLAPTFAFIDPFGYSGLPFKLISKFLTFPKGEVFITFMVESLNRFLTLDNPANSKHIMDLFGTEEATKVGPNSPNRTDKLRLIYQNQLAKVANFVRYFEMRDRDDRIIYYLFFATNHPLGHVRMKEAMWKVDELGDFRFSDATDPTQTTLFGADHDGAILNLIKIKFDGRKVSFGELGTFIEDKTPYLKKHLRESLRQAEDGGAIVVEQTRNDGKKRRGKTFPDQVILTIR